jgi:hypothetical protein
VAEGEFCWLTHRQVCMQLSTDPRSKADPWEAKAQDRARILDHTEVLSIPRAQARLVGADPHPDLARHTPILRANPCPEVTDPICRLPLPTLFYRLEALNLGDLLRIWVRSGATSAWPSPGFSRSGGKVRTLPQLQCSSHSKPYLPAIGFQGTRTLIKKRKLFPDFPPASPGQFGLPRRALASKCPQRCGYAARFRNRNRIPFCPKGAVQSILRATRATSKNTTSTVCGL